MKKFRLLPPPNWTAVHRGEDWKTKSAAKVASLSTKNVLILGDSIMAGWPNKYIENLFGSGCENIGIGGDRIENLLWRIQNHGFGAADPKYTVVLIGTNNLIVEHNNEIMFRKLLAVIIELKERLPGTRLLVLGILPRGDNLLFRRRDIDELNLRLARAKKALGYDFYDLGPAIRKHPRSATPLVIYKDMVHLTFLGYRVIGKRIKIEIDKIDKRNSPNPIAVEQQVEETLTA